MKRSVINLLCVFPLIFFILGCQTPIGKFFSKSSDVQEVKNKIVQNDNSQVDKAKGYVYGADISLKLDPQPNKYSDTAQKFTDRARLTLGEPSMLEATQLREIVKNLVSTNEALQLKGEKDLAFKDKEVMNLQSKNLELEGKLAIQQKKLDEVNQENAKLATTWKKITTGFWWIVWIIGIGFVINTIGHALPPPYNNIAAIIGLPIGFLIKLISGLVPSAKNFAGTVATQTYSESKDTLEKLVLAIEDIKKKKPDLFAAIEPTLKDKTTEQNRAVILDIKKDYSLI